MGNEIHLKNHIRKAQDLLGVTSFNLLHVYEHLAGFDFIGYSAQIHQAESVSILKSLDEVLYIEKNQLVQ